MNIQTIAARDVWSQAVLVDTPDRPRLLRTSDRLLMLEEGKLACISERRLIGRRWLRYQLELPGYCRGSQRMQRAIQSTPLPRNTPLPDHNLNG